MGTYRRGHIYVRKGAFSGRIMVARVHVHLAACGMHAKVCKSQRHQRGVRLVRLSDEYPRCVQIPLRLKVRKFLIIQNEPHW